MKFKFVYSVWHFYASKLIHKGCSINTQADAAIPSVFLLNSAKLARNDAQNILYSECNLANIILTHEKYMVVMVTLPRNTQPKI